MRRGLGNLKHQEESYATLEKNGQTDPHRKVTLKNEKPEEKRSTSRARSKIIRELLPWCLKKGILHRAFSKKKMGPSSAVELQRPELKSRGKRNSSQART